MKTLRFLAVIVSSLFLGSTAQAQVCVGDCDGDGEVEVHELIFGVRISLDLESIDDCPSFDVDGDGEVSINELILAVNNSLYDCEQLIWVTKTEDTNDGTCDGDCSLREAIIAANERPGMDKIIVPSGTYIVNLGSGVEDMAASGDLDIIGNLTLVGAGADTTVIDGNEEDRVLHVHTGTARIARVTIQNGGFTRPPADGWGGGIRVEEAAALELTDSTVSGNGWDGIHSEGDVTVANSTVDGNLGDGIFVGPQRRAVSLTNSTLSGNSGMGIFAVEFTLINSTVSGNRTHGTFLLPESVTLVNSIIADNGGSNCGTFSPVTITTSGNSLDDDGSCGLTGPGDLSEVDAHLAPLDNYGGPTDTHALCTGPGEPHPDCTEASPALDAGDNAACPDTDQRGVERPQPLDGNCDIGAYEAE